MEKNSKWLLTMLLMVLMASCGNKDYRMLTVINEDGTCSREYTFHTTQQWLGIPPTEDFDSLIDKSWERSWSVLGADSMRYPVPLTEGQLDSMQALDLSRPLGNLLMGHVKKDFKSVEEMSAHLYQPERSHLMKVEGFKAHSTLEKRFKWFYTDYTFTETFAYDGPAVFPIPLSRFLSADTISFWFTGQPDLTHHYSGAEQKELLDAIEAKISQWVNANWFTELYTTIADRYDQIPNPPLGKEEFVRQCDSLAMHPCVLNAGDDEARTKGFRKVFANHFHSDVYYSSMSSWESDTLSHQKGYGLLLSFNTNYDLVMPGKVTDAGLGEYDGQVIHYRLSGDRFIPAAYKYTIAATSRVTHVWSFIVTSLVILLAIGSFFVRRKKG